MSESQHTTAVIVALPADDDPIHKIVAEDAHVTLHFMGEAATIDPEAIEQIKTDLELMAGNLHPFAAKLSGTAELGQDKAKVVLVESAPLTKIRELLGATPAVSTAVAAVEQFPNWIPHLTLSYEDESPDTSPYQEFTVGALALWLAGEQITFPLAKTAPGLIEEDAQVASVIAAGLKEFDSSLHPRGADGRFIEKFGVIKFLSGGGWSYGRVDGINKDAESGEVKVTVTPSDLGGVTIGHVESLELSPKQIYRAPKVKAHLTTGDGKKIGGQGGSNPGGMYEIPKLLTQGESMESGATEKFYVKTPKSAAHGKNEALANHLYEEAGVPVPEVDYAADGQIYSKIVAGEQDMQAQLGNPEWTDQVRRNFVVDAWLGNRDVFGMTYDNIITDQHGTPWRIDNGGALLFRAMGAKKDDFGSKVTELDTMRQGKKAKVYGSGMSKAQELDGAERILAISPSRIEEMVADAGLLPSLAAILKGRRLYIADYYGLQLPESQKPDGGQEGTTAPLVDAADLAASKGKVRTWFKVKLHQAALLLQTGDKVEFPDGTSALYGVKDGPLTALGAQAQLLGWQTEHGADAEVMFKKGAFSVYDRPDHGSKLVGSDLAAQNWRRGDAILSEFDTPWKIKGANPSTGAVLVEDPNGYVRLLDTFGADSTGIWEVQRWDPPAPKKVEEPQGDELTSFTMAPDTGKYEPTPSPAPEKTGQAAVAETKIKADLDQPLPTGNGTPAPKKTAAAPGEKKMLIGDGTEAFPGSQLISKKDGKTYEFVKPKGQYAVVTDPNAEDPDKQLLKLASTMTQPGATKVTDPSAIEAPKTATGEVPALGMMAEAKDGWAGEITMISPDGKFVFITDANGKRKRKSTGAVSVTSAPQSIADQGTPITVQPGPIKGYGPKPTSQWNGEEKVGSWASAGASLDATDMVHVGYADGTSGLEPYTGQPQDSLEANTKGAVAVYGDPANYLGPIAASHLAAAGAAEHHETTYQVIWGGTIAFTDGTTGPSGGLVLWYTDGETPNQNGEAWELPPTGQILTIIGNSSEMPLTPPEGSGFQTHEDGFDYISPAPLYGDEAKTLSGWKGQLAEGMEISLDGQSWLTVTNVFPSGGIEIEDTNGSPAFLNAWSSATYVIKAPTLKNGDAPVDTPWTPTVTPAIDVADQQLDVSDSAASDAGHPIKQVHTFVSGDVVVDGTGKPTVIGKIVHDDDYEETVYITALGESEPSPAVNPTDEFQFLGNIHEGAVTVPIGTVAEHFKPGTKIQAGPDIELTVLSYAVPDGQGGWKVAVGKNGDPEQVSLLHVGAWDTPGVHMSSDLAVPVHLAPMEYQLDKYGLTPDVIDGLFDTDAIVKPKPIDHHALMAEAGIDFGKAQYPIFYNASSQTYFRNGPSGFEEWDDEGAWNTVGGSPAGMDKVWDGAPFTGKLSIPDGGSAPELLEGSYGYQPKPGEAVAYGTMKGGQGVLMVSPTGNFDANTQIHTVMGPDKLSIGTYVASEAMDYGGFQVIHDPFTEKPQGPPLAHGEGPQPPAKLGAKLQASNNYQPKPGETLLVVEVGADANAMAGQTIVFVKQPNGGWYRLTKTGELSPNDWSTEEITGTEGWGDSDFGATTFYTFTYLPESEDAPTSVKGLPEGFAPFVPSQGQAVLKHTSVGGKQNAYLQKQPGGGWYKMAPDGTTDPLPYSDLMLQDKLAGKNVPVGAKYELLHPKPEGLGDGDGPPKLSNKTGDWTPLPGQKVAAYSLGEHDTDPWFYVQSAEGYWDPAPNSPAAPMSLSPTTMTKNLKEANWSIVYDGGQDAGAVDTPAPSFSGYTPKAGDVVMEEANNSHWVKTPEDGKYHAVELDGTLAQSFAMSQTEWDLAAQSSPSTQVWPTAGNTYTPAGPTPSFQGYTPQPGDQVISINYAGESPTYYVHEADDTDSSFTNYEYWKPVIAGEGVLDPAAGMSKDEVPANLGPEFGNDFKLEWPLAAAPAGTDTPTFAGLTPDASDKIIKVGGTIGDSFWIQKPSGNWVPIKDGQPDPVNGIEDSVIQAAIADPINSTELVWPAPAGGAATAAPSFKGYTPKSGETVVQEAKDGAFWVQPGANSNWFLVKTDGTLLDTAPMFNSTYLAVENEFKTVWPPAGGEAPAGPAPVIKGYTPQPGEKVVQTANNPDGIAYVQETPDGNWFQINQNTGQKMKGGFGVLNENMQGFLDSGDMEIIWDGQGGAAAPKAAINVSGYQTEAGDNVLTVAAPNAPQPLPFVQKGGSGAWWQVLPSGNLGSEGIAWHQDTIDWAIDQPSYTVTVLQGTDGSKSAAESEPLTTDKYAGVKAQTPLTPGTYGFGSYTPTPVQASKLALMGDLQPGQSLYVIENSTMGATAVLVRNSDGSWKRVYDSGAIAVDETGWASDVKLESWAKEYGHTIHKAHFGAPKSAPAPTKNLVNSFGSLIFGTDKFPEAGLPEPASFGFVAGHEDVTGSPAGTWLFVQGTTPGAGLFVKLAETYDGNDNAKVSEWITVKDNSVQAHNTPSDGKPSIGLYINASTALYVSGHAGTPPVQPAPQVPAQEQTLVGPQYPGAHLPSQEDINAWGGKLTKDGHIPTSGMHVTGKGPMSGKIVSVSKDKTKATVLTGDGKKTVRLIEALKTDKTANYQAYAAPVTAKDIPQGMPLAVDTVAEALDKTAKDGKFRAILTAHPGVSQGQMVVTRATGPSGKRYNRVHLTLTPDQRALLVGMLSGSGEKGDWASSSKMSDAVAIGDLLPMRKSSQDNPDGTPRWKVDTSVKPPSHEVTAVEELENGIRLVTLKDKATGELITSRFHPGKDLTVYTWDPNKPKVITGGAFAMSETAKADGWTLTNDGGTSAIKGGADNGTLYQEPGQPVSTSHSALGQLSHSWQTLRNVSANGVVIETVDPKGSPNKSSTGTTVITVPEGVDETALGAALAKMGIDYSPMTQQSAQHHVRGLLRTLLSLDMSDVDTAKGWSDEKLFAQAGQSMGISDLGWSDVLVGVDESTGKTSFFWSDRARNALAGKAKYNLVYRAASTGTAAQIVSTVKYGSANAIMKKTTGMLDGSKSVGNGASADTDNGNHGGHGSYASASTVMHLPSKNKFADYKGSVGMMVYHRPEAVLGRIMDIRLSMSDAFGKGQGSGSDHLKYATSMPEVRDYFLGGGLPTEAIGFIAVESASERTQAIAQLKKDGFESINGRPIEEIIILKSQASSLKPSDLPPVTLPANTRPILDLPTSYDAPTAEVAA